MGLDIDFLDGPPTMIVGQTARLRVHQRDASGAATKIAIADVVFEFAPNTWARVTEGEDPGQGLLEVIEVVQSDDPLLEPTYSIEARLNKRGAQAIPPQRKIRIVPTSFEVELAFEIGMHGNYRRFALAELTQPVDWSQASVTDPERQELVVRDGVPYLRVTGLDGLPTTVEITFPNGETAILALEGELRLGGERKTAKILRPESDALPEPEPEFMAELSESVDDGVLEMPDPAPEEELEPAAAADPAAALADPAAAAAKPAAAAAPEPAHQSAPASRSAAAAAAAGALREDLLRLRRYVSSFPGRDGSDPERDRKINERIAQQVAGVRASVEAYQGADRALLVAQLEEISREALPTS